MKKVIINQQNLVSETRKRMLTMMLVLCLLLIAPSSHSQTTDFSGSWNFKEQESISGTLYANGSPKQVTINVTTKGLELASVTSNQDGDTTVKETLSFDQPLQSKTQRGRKKITTLSWTHDHKSFTAIAEIYSLTDNSKLDFKNTDVWTIEDGKLILDRKNENYTNGETWQSKATYEKQ